MNTKSKPGNLSSARTHKKVLPTQSKEQSVSVGQTSQSIDSGTENKPESKLNGNHSEPLKDEVMRIVALAEQTKLQDNPDSLPVASYPTKRHAESAASNPVDVDLKLVVKPMGSA
jgi:hypothetical protein